MTRPSIDLNAKSFDVWDAVLTALWYYRMAKDTGNVTMRVNCREVIRRYYPLRHSGIRILNVSM